MIVKKNIRLCSYPAVPHQQPQRSPRLQQHTVPRREDIASHEPNPFAASGQSSNPFGTDGDDEDDLGDNNPFAESTASRSNNPFGEDEDYDEKLNPFGTS